MKNIIIKDFGNWLVINKPSGLSVHNNEDDTNLLRVLTELGFKDFNPINRLDKETSGLMLVANDATISAKLQDALNKNISTKTYLALVRGNTDKLSKNGQWDQKLTNKGEGRVNPAGIKSQRVDSVTKYKVMSSNKYINLLELELLTGRQHQIRKHCAINKFEIIGDKRYGDRKYQNKLKKIYKLDKIEMALHSHQLEFVFEGEKFIFNSPMPKVWEIYLC